MGTNLLEEPAASIFRPEVTAAGSFQMLVLFTELHGIISQNTLILLKYLVSDSWFLEFLLVGLRFMVLIQRNTLV
jgi:hypothetical protein